MRSGLVASCSGRRKRVWLRVAAGRRQQVLDLLRQRGRIRALHPLRQHAILARRRSLVARASSPGAEHAFCCVSRAAPANTMSLHCDQAQRRWRAHLVEQKDRLRSAPALLGERQQLAALGAHLRMLTRCESHLPALLPGRGHLRPAAVASAGLRARRNASARGSSCSCRRRLAVGTIALHGPHQSACTSTTAPRCPPQQCLVTALQVPQQQQ